MFIIAFVVVLLILGQAIIIPFIFSLLIWFVVKKMRDLMNKIQFIRTYIPRWVKTILGSLAIFGILFVVADVLINNIENLAASYQEYAMNVSVISDRINELFKIDVHEEMTGLVKDFNFSKYLQSLMNSISDIISNMFMIILYTIFIFADEVLFKRKMKLIFPDKDQYKNYKEIVGKIDKSMSRYISMKSMISLMTTTLSYLVFLGVGVHSPLFWAFMVFILNFIPSVGPVLGAILPALFSLLQFGEFLPFIIILVGAGGVSMIIGNFVEPKLMGNTLNISPLVSILALIIWGSLWGIIGMLLSVPITVIMIIIFSQFPSTRSAAILLSARGRV